MWSSPDGLTFTEVNEDPPWALSRDDLDREYVGVVAFHDRIWVLGGGGGNGVWSSPDGETWTEVLDDGEAPWRGRKKHAALVFDDKMWILGGIGIECDDDPWEIVCWDVYLSDVWYSTNGADWIQTIEDGPSMSEAAVFDGRLWGFNRFGSGETTVFSSENGADWIQAPAGLPGWSRTLYGSAVYDSKLWVTGGFWGGEASSDVWYSVDGTDWVEVTSAASWPPRYAHSVLAHDDKLWVIGGSTGRDIWYTEGHIPTAHDFHTADQNWDNAVDLAEMLRAIQLFNGSGYHCDGEGEDGFAPGAGARDCQPHESDYDPQDWEIDLGELLRLIQLFNSDGYRYCPDQGAEDDFCLGAPL